MAQQHRFKKNREFKQLLDQQAENEEGDIRSFTFHKFERDEHHFSRPDRKPFRRRGDDDDKRGGRFGDRRDDRRGDRERRGDRRAPGKRWSDRGGRDRRDDRRDGFRGDKRGQGDYRKQSNNKYFSDNED